MINDSVVNCTNETEAPKSDDFLSCGNPTPKDNLKPVGNPLPGTDIAESHPDQEEDYSSCSPTELRKKFPRTYKNWDNMKQRKKKGAIIHQQFDKFKDFLRHVGPCENQDYTLDRIDNDDPEYAPGKVEWRDKYAQNSNKGDNVYLTHDNGQRHTIAQWAVKTKQKADTLYKRKAAGWNDMAVITGKQEKDSRSISDNPWPYAYRQEWEANYRKAVIKGYGESRLVFLRDEAREILSFIEGRIFILGLVVQHVIGYDDDRDECISMQYLAQHGHSINDFKDMSLEDLNQEVDKLEAAKVRCKNVLKQASLQIEHKNRKAELLMSKGKNITESDLLKFYDEAYPRPAYTINQPPANQKMAL